MLRALVLGLLLAGCSGEEPPMGQDAGMDAGSPDATPDPDSGQPAVSVEIGTGQDQFEPLTEGQTVTLTQGIQSGGGQFGGYHIWGALRTKGIDPRRPLVEFVIYDQSGGEQARHQSMVPMMEPNGEFFVAYAFSPPIADCCVVANTMVRMTVRVQDANGVEGSDERMLMAGSCIDITTGRSRCP